MDITQFSAIQPLWDKMPLIPKEEPAVQAVGGNVFSDIFQSAVDNLKQSESAANDKLYQMAVGELDNPAEWVIASQKAQTATDLLVTLRNKAMDAYSEMMRISL